MGKKVRSAKGELVDFDLLKIKEQIAAKPETIDVQKRKDFIDRRLRRRLKRVAPPVPPLKNDKAVSVDKNLPKTEELNEDPILIDEVEESESTPKSRQRSRPPKKTDTNKE